MPNLTEADTCRKYVLPKLYASGWSDEHINEQRTFTDGRIVVAGNRTIRRKQKRADYLLRYRPDFAIAIVEAKADYKKPADGLAQAKDYAQVLGIKFAYSTNGHGIIEHDFLTGLNKELDAFPSPDELWQRLKHGENIPSQIVERLLTPYYHLAGKPPRYYQEIAINRAIRAILQGQKHVLLTLATGTGKTFVAFQICHKLWSTKWNRNGDPTRRPRILYLADRNILVDDPKAKMFGSFGDAGHKIEGEAIKSREMYFATYQAIAKDKHRPGLYKEYPKDFFDLIVVDECHRGSAADDSNWKDILKYFEPALQLGMTATPKRDDNRDTYLYFGNPIYTYSLRQGIDDGFLAPYRVHRIVSSADSIGWRPDHGQVDRHGREIPDSEYTTKDFERKLALRPRTEAIARNLTDFLKANGRFDKTIVFCVDQEHAEEMRFALNNLNADLAQQYPDYVVRVTADEGSTGRGHLDHFTELETTTPAIVTTSQLLTTGVDVPTCKNIVIARVINSMTEFKQIIGRGTRVRDDYGKLYFNILDYTGSATRLFADPDFDGEPALVTEEEMNAAGEKIKEVIERPEEAVADQESPKIPEPGGKAGSEPRKFYVDNGSVEIVAHFVSELDADGKQLRVVRFTDYTGEKVRSMCPSAVEFRSKWSDAEQRAKIIEALEDRGITLDQLIADANQPDADPFDLLCQVAYSAPVRTRRERAERLRKEQKAFFEKYSEKARQVLQEILEKYVDFGTAQFSIPDILKVPPISDYGTVIDISQMFGGADNLRFAISELQSLLYAA
jgi:type I restriction enzyme R subunit